MTDSVQGASPKARPILMSAPMVRALLEGRKTQTRRIVKPQPQGPLLGLLERPIRSMQQEPVLRAWFGAGEDERSSTEITCPYGKPGDLLWVRETFVSGYEYVNGEPPSVQDETTRRVWYRATEPGLCWDHRGERDHDSPPWKPSIHMPRWASRLTLELTGVRVGRLQDISEADAKQEGVEASDCDDNAWIRSHPYSAEYWNLWDSINGSGSWITNPWVWCLSFHVHQKNVDALLERKAA